MDDFAYVRWGIERFYNSYSKRLGPAFLVVWHFRLWPARLKRWLPPVELYRA